MVTTAVSPTLMTGGTVWVYHSLCNSSGSGVRRRAASDVSLSDSGSGLELATGAASGAKSVLDRSGRAAAATASVNSKAPQCMPRFIGGAAAADVPHLGNYF